MADINPEKMKKTYEETIDGNIEELRRIQSQGLTGDDDLLLIDTCLKYVIFTSEMRTEDKQ